jgi:hypothetical protein
MNAGPALPFYNKKAALSGGFDENTLTFDYLRRRSKNNAPIPITPKPMMEGSGTTGIIHPPRKFFM